MVEGSSRAGRGSGQYSYEDRGSAGRLPGGRGGGGGEGRRAPAALSRRGGGGGGGGGESRRAARGNPGRGRPKGLARGVLGGQVEKGPARPIPAGGLGSASAPPLDPRRPCALPVGPSLAHRAGICASRLRLKMTGVPLRTAAAGQGFGIPTGAGETGVTGSGGPPGAAVEESRMAAFLRSLPPAGRQGQ